MKTVQGKKKRMTPEKFAAVKDALQFNKSSSQVAKFFNISMTTVHRIKTHDTFEAYHKTVVEQSRQANAKRKTNVTKKSLHLDLEDLNRPITLRDLVESEARIEHSISKRIAMLVRPTADIVGEEETEQEQPAGEAKKFPLFSRNR